VSRVYREYIVNSMYPGMLPRVMRIHDSITMT